MSNTFAQPRRLFGARLATYAGPNGEGPLPSWLGHDVYEDVLAGLYSAEEMVDFRDGRTSERILDNILIWSRKPSRCSWSRQRPEAPTPPSRCRPRRADRARRGPPERCRRVARRNQNGRRAKRLGESQDAGGGFVGTEFHGAMQEAWRSNPASPRAKKAAES